MAPSADENASAGTPSSSRNETLIPVPTFELHTDMPRVRVSAIAPGHALAAQVELELRPGAVVEDVVLRLLPACTLRGTALDEDGREVVDGLRFRSENGLELDVDLSDGAFELAPLPPGRGTLFRVAEPGGGPHGSLDVELEPGRENVVEVRLQGRRR